MKNIVKKIIQTGLLVAVVAGTFVQQPGPVLGQTKIELQQELNAIEQLINQYEGELAQTQAEKKTLANKIAQLKKEQTKIQLQIRSTTIKVGELEDQVSVTEGKILAASIKIDDLKTKSAGLIKTMYHNDQTGVMELLLGSDSLPEAVDQIVAVEKLTQELLGRAQEMKSTKVEMEQHQAALEEQQDEAQNLLAVQALQEQEFRVKVSEQNELLVATAGTEEQYQALLSESKKKASQIRVRLYETAGGTTTQVTFGQAVEIAKTASDATGVRAAFLLAILTQESSLGKNVGTCNRAGDPVEKSWRNVMHPTRDVPKFEAIVTELGLDPDTTPVSCPMIRNGKRIGWGGAMGPAQFIPSTWVGYKDRVTAITGRPANPWDIHDAFMAAAVLLKANGAAKDGRQGEWNAAMRYFSGGTNPAFRFYGDNVLKQTDKYQVELDALASS